MTRRQAGGFTLLEVMVAVVILAVGLSSLFTSQVGAIRIAQRARMTGVASLLVRCKMAEVEERILKEGWPGSTLEGRDECCEDAEHEGFACEYKVERIVLPDQMGGEDDENNPLKAALGQDSAGGATTAGGAAGGIDPASAIGVPLSGPLGALSGLGGAGGGGGGGGGGDPLEAMVMELTFPIMKPLIEEQVRRVTVKVKWKEGASEQDLAVVQYIVNELPMVAPDDEDADEGTTGGGSTAGSTTGGAATAGAKP